MLSLISEKGQYGTRAISTLTRYLKKDSSLYDAMQPSRPLLRKLDLEYYIMSSDRVAVEAGLDMAVFLTRFHQNVDYADFSDNVYCI
jgi:hypothetical protein